jgi:hypothetical protein
MKTERLEREFHRAVLTAIKNKNDIVFITYAGIEDTEEKIKFALIKILEQFGREEIFTPLLSCIKELLANAVKANAKKILIEEGLIDNPDDPGQVVKQIRSILNESAQLEYGMKAKHRRLSSRIYLKVQKDSITIDVINNIPLNDKELEKITRKIENSSKYENIAEFYMENPDPEAEGMGLGLSMIVIMLKNIEVSHKNFTVNTDGTHTMARITVPMNA